MKVSVYFNLHRKLFSVRADEGPEKGRVIAHANRVSLRSVTMSVGQAGNRKVRETGHKNIHAFMRGTLDMLDGSLTKAGLDLEEYLSRDTLTQPEAAKLSGFSRERMDRSINHTVNHGVKLSYDPYRDTSFVAPDMSRLPVSSAWVVTMSTKSGVHGVGVLT